MAAPTVRTQQRPQQNTQQNGQSQQAAPPIPFCRAARRKSQQADVSTYTLQTGATTPARPIELPAAGFLRYLEILIDVNVTGNSAAVAAPGGTLGFPWNVISSLQVTNAAGDSISVPIDGYLLYLINKYGGNWEPPNCDPYADPQFQAVTTGAGAGGGSFQLRLKFPFEQDARDAFCALPNLAANKAYQVVIQYASVTGLFAGGTAPNGAVALVQTITSHYWSQPQATNSSGQPQETEPGGNGSVSLYRVQRDTVSAGSRVMQLYNVGNVIRYAAIVLQSSAANNPRTDTDFPGVSYFRLNNDQMLYYTQGAWKSEMKERYGYGSAAATQDAAGFLDTGVYVLSEFMAQHEHVTPDGPRDQYLVTIDSTLFQYEANQFGATAQTFTFLQNEIKPKDAASLYSLNVV